jgi:2-keto-4-pentenoate hydratase
VDRIAIAAELIAGARRRKLRLDRLPEASRPLDEAEAYRTQAAVHRLLGARRGGHKIGCTTPTMQKFLGIANPCAGAVFDTRIYRGEVALPFDDFLHVGVECEIAVRLREDVATGPFTADRLAAAVAGYMASIEIVDDRFIDFRAVDTPTVIADDFFAWGLVLGTEVQADATAIPNMVGTTTINGVEVGRGQGRDVLGHPLNALAWLAENLCARGDYLRAGEVVTTGSLVETKWLARGDRVIVAVSGLGEVGLTVN